MPESCICYIRTAVFAVELADGAIVPPAMQPWEVHVRKVENEGNEGFVVNLNGDSGL